MNKSVRQTAAHPAHKYKGQSLIEVLIALSFATIVIVALVNVVINSIRNAQFSRNNDTATRLAQEGVEWLRVERDKNTWTDFKDLTNSYCLNSLPGSVIGLTPPADLCTATACDNTKINTVFKRCINFSPGMGGVADCPVNTLTSTVTVTWTGSAGDHSSVQKTCLSNWQNK